MNSKVWKSGACSGKSPRANRLAPRGSDGQSLVVGKFSPGWRRWAQPLGGVILVSFLNKGELGNQSEGVAGLGESPRWLKLK